MSDTVPSHALQLRSRVSAEGELEVSLQRAPVPGPGADEVLVRIQATPINPSDLGLLFGPADLASLKVSGTTDSPVVTARIPDRAMAGMAGRIGQSLPVGNEGAGLVVQAGSAPAAQALLGKTVAIIGGAMYAQYRCMPASQCLPLPDDASAADGASCFVNPLTALGMVETMRREGHKALVHTAAASNLGQMLNRICLKDGIGLVNIVRKPEQAALLFTSLGNLNWSVSLGQPMASLPVTIYQYAGSAFDDWVALAWAGALLITAGVLAINIAARLMLRRAG